MQVPRIKKVVVNIGVGEALDNAKALDAAVGDLDPDYRAKTGGHQSAQEHCELSSCAKVVRSA